MYRYNFYTSKEIKPRGWLRRQLEIQAEGLSGNLDKVWPDIRDSGWIGGGRDSWERVPYWLDGFVPLAYLLDNRDMKNRAKKYIDAILEGQNEDGWICPCEKKKRSSYDSWALQLIAKSLIVYYDCTSDERIPDAVYRMMKNYHDLLSQGEIRLFNWGKHRWFETFISLNFLKERYDEPWIDELAQILLKQGHDYRRSEKSWVNPKRVWRFTTHVVNLAMMLKTEAVTEELLGNPFPGLAEKQFSLLMEHNGTPVGIFTGDECLSGLSPVQGTELCAVAELMYSFEHLFACSGDPVWAERLEKVAFNALPATISDDMWAHQYDQMSNQISCEKITGVSPFRTNLPNSHLFGLEPNCGCCTANFNQAWPKLALSAFMHSGDTVVSAVPIPSVLDDGGIHIELITDYPFKNRFEYRIKTDKPFTLKIRIPSFAKNITVNGSPAEKTEYACFEFEAGAESTLSLSFDADVVMVDRPYGLKSVQWGSLVFALPIKYRKRRIEYTWGGVKHKFPYCDYEYVGKSEWRYAFAGGEFTLNEKDISPCPFSSDSPAVELGAELCRINWSHRRGFRSVAAKYPANPGNGGNKIRVMLYPYGSAKLRMTEMPLIEK